MNHDETPEHGRIHHFEKRRSRVNSTGVHTTGPSDEAIITSRHPNVPLEQHAANSVPSDNHKSVSRNR